MTRAADMKVKIGDYGAIRNSPIAVIPSAARDLVFSATCEEEIPRLCLGMTVATLSLADEEYDQ